MMNKARFSNLFFVFGAVMLVGFGYMELVGHQSDPLLPAFSAFLIGCTAVLDRVGTGRFE